MKLIAKTLCLVLIVCLCNNHLAKCMNTAQDKQASSVASLKDLAALKFINAFNPENQNTIVDQLEALKEQTNMLNDDLREYMRTTIVKEKSDILEIINNSSAVKLSNTEVCDKIVVSPDSQYIAYIAQKRHRDLSFNWPNDTLVFIHVPTLTQQLIKHEDLGRTSASKKTCWNAAIIFTSDSKSLLFSSVKLSDTTVIYRYDIQAQTLAVLTEVPFAGVEPVLLTPDNRYLIGKSGRCTGIMDLQQNRFTLLEGAHPVANVKANRIITHGNDQKAYCYDFQGRHLFSLPHALENHKDRIAYADISPDGQIIATTVGTTVYLSSTLDGMLLKEIAYDHKVGHVRFANTEQLIVGILTKSDYWHDLLLTDITSESSTKLVSNVWIPYTLSTDMLLYVGGQYITNGYSGDVLFDCVKQRSIKDYRSGPSWLGHQLLPDASAAIVNGVINGSPQCYPYSYSTHRAITNGITLKELLALLIAEKQYKNNQNVSSANLEILKQSSSQRLKEIVRERYKAQDSSCIVL